MQQNDRRRGGAGKWIAIGCGGAVVLVAVFIAVIFALTSGQTKVVAAHLEALKGKNVDEAMKSVDATHVPKEQLQALLDRNPQVFGSGDRSFPSREVSDSGGVKKATIGCTIKGTDGKDYAITYTLLSEGEGWKIAGIRSDDLSLPPTALAISNVKVSKAEAEEGKTRFTITFEVNGCDSRKNGAKFDYDVSLKGKLLDPSGGVAMAEKEMARFQKSMDSAGQTVTGTYDFTLPEGAGECKAVINVEDKLSGKGVTQEVPLKAP